MAEHFVYTEEAEVRFLHGPSTKRSKTRVTTYRTKVLSKNVTKRIIMFTPKKQQFDSA